MTIAYNSVCVQTETKKQAQHFLQTLEQMQMESGQESLSAEIRVA